MEQFTRLLPTLPKFFDKPSEKEVSKLEGDETLKQTQDTKEVVPLASDSAKSHENLAFEGEDPQLEQKDVSIEFSTTMDTALDSSTRETSQKANDEERGNDSGISEGVLNGSGVTNADGTTTKEMDSNCDMKTGLKAIGCLAIELTAVNTPEITVEKPKTLFSVAGVDGTATDAPSQSPRRKTDHDIKKAVLSPYSDVTTPRRHSDFVSVPMSINEELARDDFKKRGFYKTDEVKKGSVSEVMSRIKGPQWSPRLERKKQEEAKKETTKKEERRKTLAELALEAGYQANVDDSPVNDTSALQVAQEQTTKESIESLSCEQEDEHYNSIPVTGELYVSLRYDMASNKFEVHIHSANNLACADPKTGFSDPYVKIYLLPDKRSKRKTKNKKDTLNPKYDELMEYSIGYDELLTRTLQMSVWHKVIGRNVFLGEVLIPMNEFTEVHGNALQQSIAKWFTLKPQSSDATDGLPSAPCELVLALKYVTADKVKQKKGRQKGELQIHLLEARNLPAMDADGMSDPYCKCHLLPDKKGKWKHKTPVIKRTLNPTFNHKFSYEELSIDDLKEKVLEIVLYDYDLASSDEFLGGVRLGLGTSSNEWDDATEDECQIWQTMLSRSNVWIQVVVPLRSSMVSKTNASK